MAGWRAGQQTLKGLSANPHLLDMSGRCELGSTECRLTGEKATSLIK